MPRKPKMGRPKRTTPRDVKRITVDVSTAQKKKLDALERRYNMAVSKIALRMIDDCLASGEWTPAASIARAVAAADGATA